MLYPIDIYNEFGERKVNELAYDPNYEVLTSGLLVVGKSYKILISVGGTDFLSVGALSNDIGTRFVCNKSTIDWKGSDSLQRGYTNEENIQNNITAAENSVKSIAVQTENEYSDSNVLQRLAVMYYTLYLLYVENEQPAAAATERKEAMDILARIWGGSVYTYDSSSNPNYPSFNQPLKKVGSYIAKPDWETFDAEEGNYGRLDF